MSIAREHIVGVVLAGGLSRRMFAQGSRRGDKGLLDIAGAPMLQRVLDRLTPQVHQTIINANGDPARFARFGFPVVPDGFGDLPGPLAGVLAGLQWAQQNIPGASHIVTASTDAPFLPANLVQHLSAGLEQSGQPIALAASGGHLHPVIGLWPVALANDLENSLKDGVRKVLHWTDRHGHAEVNFASANVGGNKVDPFFNANTPEELSQARAILESTSH